MSQWVGVSALLACAQNHGPSEHTPLDDAGTELAPDARISSTIDGPASAVDPTPQCTDQSLEHGRRIIVLAGTKQLTSGSPTLERGVDETWFHGTITETKAGIPADIDLTSVLSSNDDFDSWQFARVTNDTDESWTILAQGLDDISFGVGANANVDVRLRYKVYDYAPTVLELTILEDAVPAFYYGTAAETSQLDPPPGLGVTLGELECTAPSECFTNVDFYALRVDLPGDRSTTLGTGEQRQLDGYTLKNYGAALGRSGVGLRCPDASADRVELAVARSTDAANAPRCNDQAVVSGPRFIVAAGAELLTYNALKSDAEVEETWLHGKVIATGTGIPDNLDPAVVAMLARDSDGWQFVSISNDSGDPWTILAQHFDAGSSFGVTADTRVDVRLRYGSYTHMPMLLELEMLEDTVPVFYYANAGDRMKLLPPHGLGISLGEIECSQPAECFKNLEFLSLRVEIPRGVVTTLTTGESAQLGDYSLKHYGTVAAETSICMDAVAGHIELAVTRSP